MKSRLIILIGAERQLEASRVFVPAMNKNNIDVFSPWMLCQSILDEVLPLEPGEDVNGLTEDFYAAVENKTPGIFFRMFISHMRFRIQDGLDIIFAYDGMSREYVENLKVGKLFDLSIWATHSVPLAVDRLWENGTSDDELTDEVLKYFGRVHDGKTLALNAQ